MKIVLSARGSRGDVRPIVSLAAEMRNRGHDVTVCLPSSLASMAKEEKLQARFYQERSQDVMQGFEAGWTAAKQALDWFAGQLDHQMEILVDALEGADALVSTVNELVAPSAAQLRGVPYFRLAYVPVLAGSQPPPLIPIQGMPGPVNQTMWRMLNGSIDLLFRGRVNDTRALYGLPPISRIDHYLAGSSHTLLAVSPYLVPSDPAWRFEHSFVGYCFGGDQGPLPPEVEMFLDRGQAPIYLGFGSVSLKDPDAMTTTALEAAERAGCRLLIGRGWAGLGKGIDRLPDWALTIGDVPHATLFPRLAAAVHHGGSGTLHNAARAGIPQLALPQIADQYYWADRIHQLGLGPAPVSPGNVDATTLESLFSRLLSPGFRITAQRLAVRMAGENGTARAAQQIETLLSSRDMASPQTPHANTHPEPRVDSAAT